MGMWERFWNHTYWLPRADTWADVPIRAADLKTAFLLALPLCAFRLFFEAFVGFGLARLLGLSSSPVLSSALRHLRGGFRRNSHSKKVLECLWRFVAYLFLFVLGVVVLRDKPWLWDVQQGFVGYPRHQVEGDVHCYYMIEMAFYISLILLSPFDVRRSDSWQMLVHHMVTIGLISFSWTINFVRIGTLVLLSHDINDIFLELCKLVRYSGRFAALSNGMFVLFLITWVASRLIYFPFFVVYTGIRDGPRLIQPDYNVWDLTQAPYAPRVILLLLVALMFLHIFWTFLIVKVVVRALKEGEASDVRSDSESGDERQVDGKKKTI